MRSRLLLDAGGVLVSVEVTTALFASLGLPHDMIWEVWQANYRVPFWRGEISIEQALVGIRGWAEAMRRLRPELGGQLTDFDAHRHMNLLPWAFEAAALPCRKAILSNHRHEWLLPAIRPIVSSFDAIFVSDMIRTRKPEPEAFLFALRAWGVQDPTSVIFVDDQDQNLEQASELGMRTLKADPASRGWIDDAKMMLET
jgi:FMN phosphatase YigB (HAD superfamily)